MLNNSVKLNPPSICYLYKSDYPHVAHSIPVLVLQPVHVGFPFAPLVCNALAHTAYTATQTFLQTNHRSGIGIP